MLFRRNLSWADLAEEEEAELESGAPSDVAIRIFEGPYQPQLEAAFDQQQQHAATSTQSEHRMSKGGASTRRTDDLQLGGQVAVEEPVVGEQLPKSFARLEFSESARLAEPVLCDAGVQVATDVVAHQTGTCRPCISFNRSSGCSFGASCDFCHMEHDLPKGKRMCKKKRDRMRKFIERQLAQTGPASGDAMNGDKADDEDGSPEVA
mmetsp:Transcript_647/g.1382  ORF Transcript_647/g.1382 Transcript_647/m.1382 type:complete len:207 (+) Transcript_647:28-648(+)